jgi:acetyl esterase/lipase
MSTVYLLDPELTPLLGMMGDMTINAGTLPKLRDTGFGRPIPNDDPEVLREEIFVANPNGPDVRCLLYKPATTAGATAGYLHLHGGGYVMGAPEGSIAMSNLIVRTLGVIVLSSSYRLAPEHLATEALDDAYLALGWLHEHADELGIDSRRIGIGGESAGGGLAASLAIRARDRGEYAICHQHLTYPMLDDRTGTEAAPGDPLTGEFVWTRASNRFGWQSYLGDLTPAAPYVPARLEDFTNLPPTWIHTVTLDLFRDENILYAQKLLSAGVPTELIVSKGGCHGFQMVPETGIGRRYQADFLDALGRGLAAVD